MIAGSSAAVARRRKRRRRARAASPRSRACRRRRRRPTTTIVRRSGSRSRISATFGQFATSVTSAAAPESAQPVLERVGAEQHEQRHGDQRPPGTRRGGRSRSRASAAGGSPPDRRATSPRPASTLASRIEASRTSANVHSRDRPGLVLDDQRQPVRSLRRVAVDRVGGDVVARRDVPAGVAPELVVRRHARLARPSGAQRLHAGRVAGERRPVEARRRCPARSAR